MTFAIAPSLDGLADAQDGVLLGSQLRNSLGESGGSRSCRTGALQRLWQGAYVTRAATLERRLVAADLTLGAPARPCGATAAAHFGFDLDDDPRLHLIADGQSDSKRAEIALHRIEPTLPLVTVAGRQIMDPVEVAVRVAAEHLRRAPNRRGDRLRSGMSRAAAESFDPWLGAAHGTAFGGPRALAVLDAAMAAQPAVTRSRLSACAKQLSIRGIRPVRNLIEWADADAESPRESWLRWIVRAGGLPPPQLQWWVTVGSGRRYRLDLAWPDFGVGCEYDGMEFHTGAALDPDRQRLTDVMADGWLMMLATDATVTSGRPELLDKLGRMLRSRGASW